MCTTQPHIVVRATSKRVNTHRSPLAEQQHQILGLHTLHSHHSFPADHRCIFRLRKTSLPPPDVRDTDDDLTKLPFAACATTDSRFWIVSAWPQSLLRVLRRRSRERSRDWTQSWRWSWRQDWCNGESTCASQSEPGEWSACRWQVFLRTYKMATSTEVDWHEIL